MLIVVITFAIIGIKLIGLYNNNIEPILYIYLNGIIKFEFEEYYFNL